MAEFVTGFHTPEGVKKYDYNSLGNKPESFSNALNGSATGASVQIDDVSPMRHEVKCKVRGKNLWRVQNITDSVTSAGGFVYTYDNGTFSYKGTTIEGGGGRNDLVTKSWAQVTLSPGTYTYSINILSGSIDGLTLFMQTLKEQTIEMLPNYTFTLSEPTTIFFGINRPLTSGIKYDVTFNIQVEIGSNATEYVPYIDPTYIAVTCNEVVYTPNEDGIVEGLLSSSPTMTFTTDTENTVVEVEYQRDINVLTKAVPLIDRVTGVPYYLYVSGGKLLIEERG